MIRTTSRAVSQQGNHHCLEVRFPNVPNVPFLLEDSDNDWVLVLPPLSSVPWVSVAWNKGAELSSAGLSLQGCSAGRSPAVHHPQKGRCAHSLLEAAAATNSFLAQPTWKHPWKFSFLQGTPRGGQFCRSGMSLSEECHEQTTSALQYFYCYHKTKAVLSCEEGHGQRKHINPSFPNTGASSCGDTQNWKSNQGNRGAGSAKERDRSGASKAGMWCLSGQGWEKIRDTNPLTQHGHPEGAQSAFTNLLCNGLPALWWVFEQYQPLFCRRTRWHKLCTATYMGTGWVQCGGTSPGCGVAQQQPSAGVCMYLTPLAST